MRIIGIDPGLRLCGFAVLDSIGRSYRLVEAGVIRVKQGLPLEKRLNQISNDLDSVLERDKPNIMAVEDLYSHYAHPKTAILMGHARGVIFQRAANCGIDVQSFAATKIKKSLTGNGRASKRQMQLAIQSVLSLPQIPEPPDVADAIAIALCCSNSSMFV